MVTVCILRPTFERIGRLSRDFSINFMPMDATPTSYFLIFLEISNTNMAGALTCKVGTTSAQLNTGTQNDVHGNRSLKKCATFLKVIF
jgi:hypothetical protein